MPWTAKDAKAKNQNIKSDSEAAMWMKVANKQLSAALEKGVDRKEAEARAIKAANAALKNMHAKTKRESIGPDGQARILEYADSRGAQVSVDRQKGLISGVKILGLVSRNGRTYLPEAIQQAAGLYEGKRVNVDHSRSGDSRSYRDRMGKLQNVTAREDGLYGDLFVNPQHVLAEQLFWDAENAPENVGLSHDVSGKVTRRGGKPTVESIDTVRSVDLVADPATTAGLFEDEEPELEDTEIPIMEIDLKEATLDQLTAERPDLLEAITKKLAKSEEAKAKDEQIKKLTEEVAAMKASTAKAVLEAAIAKELAEAKLDPENETACPDFFMEQLQGIAEADKRKPIIEDRKKLVEAAASKGKPISESRHSDGGGLQEMTPAQRASSWR